MKLKGEVTNMNKIRTVIGEKLMDLGQGHESYYIDRYNSTWEDIMNGVKDLLFWLGERIHPWPKEK